MLCWFGCGWWISPEFNNNFKTPRNGMFYARLIEIRVQFNSKVVEVKQITRFPTAGIKSQLCFGPPPKYLFVK